MRLAAVALLAMSLGSFIDSFRDSWLRPTNSHAASRRGTKAYESKQYSAAAEAFDRAQRIEATPLGAFDLGTARIAAGEREAGAAALESAIRDPSLRADALFNRGNAALGAQALDRAVHDYVEALKADPSHAAAKRNLEIALARQQQNRERGGGSGQQNQQGSQQQQQQPPKQPAPGDGKQQAGAMDMEALLRSVQQQEQEELRRMKGQAGEARVGW